MWHYRSISGMTGRFPSDSVPCARLYDQPGGNRLECFLRPQHNQTVLTLRPLTDDDEPAARAAHAELAHDGFEFLLDEHDGEPWANYVLRRNLHAHGIGLPEGFVPETFLLAFAEGELVGRVSIRHTLNDFLVQVGGHIGYCVRPGFRRCGYATEILRQALVALRALGVDEALVTCDDDNLASARTIERCGGVLDDLVESPTGGPVKRRYWIGLSG